MGCGAPQSKIAATIRHLVLDIKLCAWYAMGAAQISGSLLRDAERLGLFGPDPPPQTANQTALDRGCHFFP